MTALRRTRSGPFRIEQAITPDELSRRKAEGMMGWLAPPQAALPELPVLDLTPLEERALYQGKPVSARESGLCWLRDASGAVVALGKAERGTLRLHINLKD
jgi:tRNA U55 pseudouridine synthase TruB